MTTPRRTAGGNPPNPGSRPLRRLRVRTPRWLHGHGAIPAATVNTPSDRRGRRERADARRLAALEQT
jgi:hypothetical protein